jgi:8-oxo-dGTP pyrophosphatase MutT (NUDIX family)
MNDVLRQAGAIPFRHEGGALRVLLITSRDTGRWVIPKGGVDHGHTPAQAAVIEAFEEAGIKGSLHPSPLGLYTYGKRLKSGITRPTSVEVYALEFEKQLKKWPERSERPVEWMAVSDAVAAVEEQGLRLLMLRLSEIHLAVVD